MDYAAESLRLHKEWQGKIEVVCRAPLETRDDLSLAYTPGVAQPCLEIQKNPDKMCIRDRYKGTDPKVDVGENQTIDVNGSFDQWNSAKITANYEDYVGDTADRDAKGFGELEYKNTTGRNDIQNMKVARDFDNLYFYVDTVDDITKDVYKRQVLCFIELSCIRAPRFFC